MTVKMLMAQVGENRGFLGFQVPGRESNPRAAHEIRFTLDDVKAAAEFLAENRIDASWATTQAEVILRAITNGWNTERYFRLG